MIVIVMVVLMLVTALIVLRRRHDDRNLVDAQLRSLADRHPAPTHVPPPGSLPVGGVVPRVDRILDGMAVVTAPARPVRVEAISLPLTPTSHRSCGFRPGFPGRNAQDLDS